ncbi:MAG: hypothetical protein LBM66_03760, partial [Bifidobacteriaceae bacterium]|nr:hypothetical protein [Bifidobacteriaceae bacterium]
MRPSPTPPTSASRVRRAVAAACAAALAVTLAAACSRKPAPTATASIPLYQQTMGLTAAGAWTPVTDPSVLCPGTRVICGAADAGSSPSAGTVADAGMSPSAAGTGGAEPSQAVRQRAWVAASTGRTVMSQGAKAVWTSALLDLDTALGANHGLVPSGGSKDWDYVWPRDASFAVVALARTGHAAEAATLLDFLQRIEPADGRYQARYRTDGTVPDRRGVELDATGWVLWALAGLAGATPADRRAALVSRYRSLYRTSVSAAIGLVNPVDGSVPAAMDYWERKESEPTLGTAA